VINVPVFNPLGYLGPSVSLGGCQTDGDPLADGVISVIIAEIIVPSSTVCVVPIGLIARSEIHHVLDDRSIGPTYDI
jgi:hypothetical protein